MAGVTNAGFVPKRFNEIIADLQANAKPIFQDLVQPGEEVDTSDTSTIGRLIGLVTPSLDEVWQSMQQVYQAFDPNSATGVALDNIVQYMGITRRVGRPTVLRASVWGLLRTAIPEGQVIRGATPDRFVSTAPLTFSVNDMTGFSVNPNSIIEGQDCTFTFIVEEGIYTLTHTVVVGNTISDVLNTWKTQFDALALSRYDGKIEAEKFYFTSKEYFAFVSVPSLTNSVIVDVKKRLTFNSEKEGNISAPIDTVTTILTPVFGWTSVTNEVSAEKGSTQETDEELRARFRISKAARANNLAEALYSQLLELEDVKFVRVYENTADSVDTKGLPPHSFMAIVRGGSNSDIGEVVWNNKPLGIASEGNTLVTIRDSQNIERSVKFSRATEIPIYVNVTVKKVGSTFPNDGAEQIRQALVNYINDGAVFGEEIIYTRMFTPINSVLGHQVNSLEIGKTSIAMGTTNLLMNWDEFPIGLAENINITVVE